jgi:hypothetical protein
MNSKTLFSTGQKSKTMTSKDIQDYIEIDLGQDMRHDPCMLLEATQETAATFGLDEWKVLRFHTRYGRAIREHFSFIYQA